MILMDFTSDCLMPCLLCYDSVCHIKIAGLTLRKSGLLLLTYTGKPAFIHNTMITVLVRDYNQISQSFYDSVINDIQLHQLTCSCGHSACLSVHGYYKRSVKRDEEKLRLRICRVKCSVCGTTHAILLSSIVPYSQMSLVDQQHICLAYEAGDDTCGICEDHLSIDENNVKSVLRNYRRYWHEKLRSLRILLSPLTDLVSACFSFYSSQFMQIHRRSNQLFSSTT